MISDRKSLIFTAIAITLISVVTGLFLSGDLLPSQAAGQMYLERTATTQAKTVMVNGTGDFILTTTTIVVETTPDGEFYTFNSTASLATTAKSDHPANQVWIVSNNFIPWTVTVPVGTNVTWINKSDSTHTVTSDTGLFNQSLTYDGASFTYTFNTSGVFSYHCVPHQSTGMTGKIIVQ